MDDAEHSAKVELEKVEQNLVEIENQITSLLNKQSSLQERKSFLKQHLKLLAEQQNSAHDWKSENFSWSSELGSKCSSVFGIDNFRANQLETMNTTLSGLDCILVMPTGAGKSLCYQLPALLGTGLTLVISPLVSLMEDQIMSLEKRNVNAVMLNAASSKETVNTVYADMVKKSSSLQLLYVTPEKLAKSKRFMNKLEQCYKAGCLTRIAIDEVHCCSQWGHDFRPDYKFLGILKKQFPKAPILGLTATASNHVLVDVQKILQIPHAQVYKGSFNRKNLRYIVEPKPSSHEECMNKIQSLIANKFKDQSGIVYCISRKDTATVADDLSTRGIKSACYHADLDPAHRSKIHSRWSSGEIQVIVATIAFGMGIDKPDVRFVIHHSLSKSMENYYQESGRAGRNGLDADCILLYRLADVYRQSCMVFTESTGLEKLYSMVEYCHSHNICRRRLIAAHFSQVWRETSCNQMCDYCDSDLRNNVNLAIAHSDKDVQIVYNVLDKAAHKDTRLTGQKVLEAMMGKGATQYRCQESSSLSKDQCEYLLARMLTSGSIREEFHFTPYSTISYLVTGSRQFTVKCANGDSIPDTNTNRKSDQCSIKNKSKKRKRDDTVSRSSKSAKLIETDVIVLSD